MRNRLGKNAIRAFGTVKSRRLPASSGSRRGGGDGIVPEHEHSAVYLFPTVEGPDAEYVKVISGKVDHRKPSFA